MLTRLFLSGLLLLCMSGARATILLQPASGNPSADGSGGFNWKYDVFLQPSAFLSQGDQLVIYDVAGFKGGSFQNAAVGLDPTNAFAVTQQNTGPVPGFLPHTDSSSIPNAVLTLTAGPDIRQTDPTAGSLMLGTLTVDSTFGQGKSLDYGSLDRHLSRDQVLPLFAVSSVAGPVPEPSTVGFMGLGLAAAMALGLRRRSRGR